MLQTDICIVGGGISGLALAAFLLRERPGLPLVVLEQAARPGGIVKSFRQDGWLAEWGPHGFLDNCPEGRELVALAGLEQDLVRAPLGRFVRYLCLGGKLAPVPQTPAKILMAPLMRWQDKFGLAWRDLTRPFMTGEPTVAEWIRYRFGPAMLPFADAAYTGTYAGDLEELRIDGVMPSLRALEKEYGSIIRALFARLRAKARERRKTGAGKLALPAMQSFRQGMEQLPLALAAQLQAEGLLHLETRVQRLRPDEDAKGWLVQTDGAGYRCRELVLALPANTALQLLPEGMEPPAAGLPEARLASVILGFGPEARIPFGFGYLAPEREQRFAMGTLFSSHMFPERVPADGQLLEVLVGGRRHPERLELEDNEMIRETLADLRQLIHLPAAPRFATILRGEAGIPQAEQQYLQLLSWREQSARSSPHLHLLGFGWQGIGLNEMIREAKNLALRLLRRPSASQSEIKGVYM